METWPDLSLRDGGSHSSHNAPNEMSERQLFDTSVALRYSHLFGNKAPFPTVKKVLRQFNLSSVVVALSQINTLIAIAKVNDEASSNLSDYLIDNYFDAEIRNNPKFIEARRAGDSIFGRQQLLTLIRLCFLECSDDGTLLADGHTPGGYELGRCYLMLSDHYFTKKMDEAISVGSTQKRRRNLALQLAPQFELNFPQELKRIMVRWELMLTDVLNSRRVKQKLGSFDLAAQFRTATSLGLDQYRDFIFATLVYYFTLSLEDIVHRGHILKMHRSGYIKESLIRQVDYNHYLDIDSMKISEVRFRMHEFAKNFPKLLPNMDFGVLRRWTLLELDTNFLFGRDPLFLVEKLGDGVRHTIRDSLSTRLEKEQASTAYGYLFEGYVDSIMRRVYPRGSEMFISFPDFVDTKQGLNEAFDGIVVCDDGHLIVMEYKGGFLSAEAKYSGKMGVFQRELDKKFGTGQRAGAHQLVKKIERLFHEIRGARDSIKELIEHQRPITKVSPVLVVQETFLGWDFMTEILNRRFQKLLKKAKITKAVKVMPLQIIDVDSLEVMTPNLIAMDFRLEQTLNARAHADPDLISNYFRLTQVLFPSFGARADVDVEDRFNLVTERIRKSFWGITV